MSEPDNGNEPQRMGLYIQAKPLAVRVEIAAEAAPGKGARLRRLPDGDVAGDAPRRVERGVSADSEGRETGPAARQAADLALEIASAREITLEGGGTLTIDPTRALTAIDVDSRAARGDRVNVMAAQEVARQISLRRLSGLIIVDFIGVPPRAVGDALRADMLMHLKDAGVKADATHFSKFGVLELAVERQRRPLHEILFGADGAPTAQTTALEALRALEREGEADRGARLTLTVSEPVAAWLKDNDELWRSAMTDRLGARFAVEAASAGAKPDLIDVAQQ